jgi:YHS domain-containing protein
MAAGLMIGAVSGASAADKKAAAAAAPKCPACGMALSSKKTKANPTSVKIKGKTYYCCAKCDMNKKAAPKK